MTERDDDIALEQMFHAARSAAPPSDDFLARLDADALAAQPKPAALTEPKRRWWRMTGTWGALGALASTAAAGVWIGVALPETLTVPGYETTTETEDVTTFLPGYGSWGLEEEG